LLQRRLKTKQKGSNNRHKLVEKIARLHQRISDTRKDWHFKLAHKLCDGAGMMFVEDIDFRVWAKGMLGKHTLDAGFGEFLKIVQWVCWKRGVYFAKVNKDYTSQVCPQCEALPGLIGITLYLWEFNVRSSVILGIVGAGGIGYELLVSLKLLDFPRLTTILILILTMVSLIDAFSAYLRQRLG